MTSTPLKSQLFNMLPMLIFLIVLSVITWYIDKQLNFVLQEVQKLKTSLNVIDNDGKTIKKTIDENSGYTKMHGVLLKSLNNSLLSNKYQYTLEHNKSKEQVDVDEFKTKSQPVINTTPTQQIEVIDNHNNEENESCDNVCDISASTTHNKQLNEEVKISNSSLKSVNNEEKPGTMQISIEEALKDCND